MMQNNNVLLSGVVSVFVIITSILLPVIAFAHDKSQHRGKPIEGEISLVSSEEFEMQSGDKTVTVIFTEKSRVEMGKEEISKDELVKGMRVRVYGTKLPGGKVAAKEILLEDRDAARTNVSGEQHHETEYMEDHGAHGHGKH